MSSNLIVGLFYYNWEVQLDGELSRARELGFLRFAPYLF